jgi:hypothetical protein
MDSFDEGTRQLLDVEAFDAFPDGTDEQLHPRSLPSV